MKKIVFPVMFITLGSIYAGTKHASETSKTLLDKLYTNISGFGIDTEESQRITEQGSSPVYGEITYDSVDTLLKELKLNKKDVFYDLGCGVGKMVIQVYLTSPAKKCAGVELSPTRYKYAQQVKEELKKAGKVQKRRPLEFLNQDMCAVSLDDATVVYLASTCFSDELMQKITNKLSEGKPGLRVLTLRRLSPHKNFKLVKEYQLPMTWAQNVSVYKYQLIK